MKGSAALLALALACAAGCGATRPPADLVVAYAPAAPIALPVCLVLDAPLRAADWRDRSVASMGLQERIAFGDAFAEHAERLARATFTSVSVVEDAATAPKDDCAVLAPRFVGAARTRPARRFDELRLAVVMEWWLRDPHGRPVWVETIRAVGVAPLEGILFNRDGAQDRIGAALEELFLASQRAIADSPEVKAYATQWSSRSP